MLVKDGLDLVNEALENDNMLTDEEYGELGKELG